ncbi:MAG: hypothetical protein AAGJ35_09960 [Myxococcota bacterium]
MVYAEIRWSLPWLWRQIDLEHWETARYFMNKVVRLPCSEDLLHSLIEFFAQRFTTPQEALGCGKALIEEVRVCMREEPRSTFLFLCLIRLFLKLEQAEQAEKWWSIAIKIEGQSGLFWKLGVHIALLQEEMDIAQYRLKTCAVYFLQDDDPLLLRAQASYDMAQACIHWGKQQFEQAMFMMRRALQHDPHWYAPWQAMLSYLSCQKYSHALQKQYHAKLDACREHQRTLEQQTIEAWNARWRSRENDARCKRE